MESGFQKASSGNLPEVFEDMITAYLTSDTRFSSPEMRGEKLKRSGKSQYGDQAVGYVQIKRDGDECTVRAKITPEHKVSKRPYSVSCVINEIRHSIVSSNCEDCTASLGGCKHAVAIIYWLHRRTEEKSPTEVTNYWRKSTLAGVKEDKGVTLENLFEKKYLNIPESEADVLADVIENSLHDGTILGIHLSDFKSVSLHALLCDYKDSLKVSEEASPIGFQLYCREAVSQEDCERAYINTINQADSPLWYEMRYGRITASIFFEASVCRTDGSLVNKIFGSSLKISTPAMERGKRLEKDVLKVFADDHNVEVASCGIMLDPDLPIFGASPDGVTENYTLEVKCPSKEATIKNYIANGVVTPKVYAQMQLQMHLLKRTKGLLIVADVHFEANKKYTTTEVEYNKEYVEEKLGLCFDFWAEYVWPHLLK